jgi:hypothetical protein
MENPAQKPDLEELEARIAELETLTDDLGAVPEEDLTRALDRAVEILEEVNIGVEAAIQSLGRESREVGELLNRVDFGTFDAALAELENEERTDGEPGP